MDNNKIQCRSFLDAVHFANKHAKKFDLSMGDHLKAALFGKKDVDAFLDAKRLEYNTTIVSLIKKFGIKAEDVYSDLDKIWLQSSTAKKEYKGEKIVDALCNFENAINLNSVDIRNNMIIFTAWDSYKSAVYMKMEEYVRGMGYGK